MNVVRVLRLVTVAAVAAGIVGCGSSPDRWKSEDPIVDLRNPRADPRLRTSAVDQARQRAGTDPVAIASVTRALKDIAWSTNEYPALRLAAITSLINDTDPAVAADAREMGKLMLPREQERPIVVYLAKSASDRGWTDYIPPLIRSYARPLKGVEDQTRVEGLAIKDLSGGRPVADTVFEVFLNPPKMPETYGLDWATRFRSDAWDLLGRLDADGTRRVELLASANGGDGGDRVIADIRTCLKDLRSVPLTGDELTWLGSLRSDGRAMNAAWWSEATAAVQSVAGNGPFHLRHAEPIRWARANRPEWLGKSRSELASELRGRLEGRTRHDRSADTAVKRNREDLAYWEPKMSWGDLLTVLVVDEALSDVGVRRALVGHADLDFKDKTTEYGGLLGFQADAKPRVVLFPPRPGQRQGDQKFIASDDMLAASDLALAHYHFHAQKRQNGDYAGPSEGDMVYAARYGRTCLVLTSLGERELAVDLYQPDGVILDLGDFSAGAEQ